MLRLITFISIVFAVHCAAPKKPEGASIQSSRDAGGVTPTPTPSSSAAPTTLYGAEAADPQTRAAADACYRSNKFFNRKGGNTCDANPEIQKKFRSFADLKNPAVFPAATLTALQAWMARTDKAFLEKHFDFAVTCRKGAPATAVCTDSAGAAIVDGTVIGFAKDDPNGSGSVVVSFSIIQRLFD